MQVRTLLQTDNHAITTPSVFYRPDALPAAQPTASNYWRHSTEGIETSESSMETSTCIMTLGLCSPSSITNASQTTVTPCGWEGNRGPGAQYWQLQPVVYLCTWLISLVGCLPRNLSPALALMAHTDHLQLHSVVSIYIVVCIWETAEAYQCNQAWWCLAITACEPQISKLNWTIDELSCSLTSHSTQNGSLWRRFPSPSLGLVWKKLNLTQQKHAVTNQEKCTTAQNKHEN